MKKILLVEDNESNIYLIDFILRKAGHRVIVARDGEEGIELALKEMPDLILMDVQLPGIDGLEAARRIRGARETSQIPVIALTSHAMIGDSDRAFRAGCTGYIEKPINPDTFDAEIEKYMKVVIPTKRYADDKPRVLIVDDSSDEQYLLETLLNGEGYETVLAENGAEALEILKKERIDVIVSDILMPKMDGYQLCRECKNDDSLRRIPFIFYTATYTDKKAEELGLGIGAERFLIKPQNESVFLRHIEEVIDHYRKNNFVAGKKRPLKTEPVFLSEYNELLVRKLEQKNLELQQNEARLRSLVNVLQYDAENIQNFLDYALEEAIRLTGSRLGYIYFYHEERQEFVLNSWSKDVMKECTIVNPQTCYELDKTGIWGEAVRQRRPIILNDFQAGHPLKKGYPEGHARLFRFMTIPVFGGSRIVAVVGVANKESNYNDTDVLQLTLLMEGVWKVVGRKRTEEELRKKTEELDRYFTSSLDLLCIADREGRFRRLNPEWEKTLGYPVAELIGKPFIDFVHPEDRENTLAAVAALVSAKEILSFVNRYRHRDGSYRWLEWRSYPAGGLIYATARDITENRKLEAQLLQAQKMEAIGTLAGGIAHDFNNILSAIIGYGHVAMMNMAKDDPQRLNIENILEAADRAAHLTKELLLFSRKQFTERKTVDLNEVVRKVEMFLKRVIGEDIECKTVLQKRPIPVYADSHQLEQVLMNLAANARDAMLKGGVFTVTTEQTNLNADFTAAHGYGRPGVYALLSVSDTGTGMNEEMRKRIFEPFFTTKEVGKGTGLGLAVVYGIVKQHEGFINVYSEPETGTVFKIYLPLISMEDQKEVPVPHEKAPARGTETVLVAEDDEALRKLASTVLVQFGYTVIEAVDGEDAVKKFRENQDRIHLLLFDLIMPRMNGKEAFDAIRKLKPDVKVIFSSGYSPDLVQQKVSMEEGTHQMLKPISPYDLLRKVRSVLDG